MYRSQMLWGRFLPPACDLLFAMGLALYNRRVGGPPGAGYAALVMAVIVAGGWVFTYPVFLHRLLAGRLRGAANSSRNYLILGRFHIRLDATGLAVRGVHVDTRCDWAVVGGVEVTPLAVCLITGAASRVMVPLRCFESTEHRDRFIRFACDHCPQSLPGGAEGIGEASPSVGEAEPAAPVPGDVEAEAPASDLERRQADDVVEVQTVVTAADYGELGLYLAERAPAVRAVIRRNRVLPMIALLLLSIVFLLVDRQDGSPRPAAWNAAITLSVIGVAWFLCYPAYARRSIAARLTQIASSHPNSLFVGCFQVRFDAQAVTIRGAHVYNRVEWAAVEAVDETSTAVYLQLGAGMAYLMPHRCFESEEHFARFVQFARDHCPERLAEKR